MKIYDLSIPLEDSPSEPLPVQVDHQSHADSAQQMAGFFDATVDDLPNGLGWANDHVTLNAHSGTGKHCAKVEYGVSATSHDRSPNSRL